MQGTRSAPGDLAAAEPILALAGATAPAAGADHVVTEVLEILLERAQDALDGEGGVGLQELETRLPLPADRIRAAVDRLVGADHARRRGDEVALTDEGYGRAVVAVRRHRLTERLLSDVIGMEWWKVHHEASRFEGVVSDDLERCLLQLLGDPGTCPHGNPIPGSANTPHHPEQHRLGDAPAGPVHVVRITETLEGDDEALQLLQECGFVPGRDAEIKGQRDGWVEVAGTVHDAALPPHVAANTYVTPL